MVSKALSVVLMAAASNAAKQMVATFAESMGIMGTVTVDNGKVIVDLDLSMEPDLPTNFSFCMGGGLSWHIHEIWTHGDNAARTGSECSGTYTSGHYDPWNACGGASASPYCYKPPAEETDTQCISTAMYVPDMTDPLTAEVGDWSAKYGKLDMDDMMMITEEFMSYYEVMPAEVTGKSVVFHCNNGDRAFCAPFMESTTAVTNTMPPAQDAMKTVIAEFDVLDDSEIMMSPDGMVSVSINSVGDTEAAGCTDIEYSIFNAGSMALTGSKLGDECINYVGDQYDPTDSCLPWSDSPYCGNMGSLCDNSTYEYACDFANDRYSCAVGDLSGKLGMIDSAALPFEKMMEGATDLLLPQTDSLIGKVIALHCGYEDSGATIKYLACASIAEYDMDMETTMDDGGMGQVTTMEGEDGVAHMSFIMAFVVAFAAVFY